MYKYDAQYVSTSSNFVVVRFFVIDYDNDNCRQTSCRLKRVTFFISLTNQIPAGGKRDVERWRALCLATMVCLCFSKRTAFLSFQECSEDYFYVEFSGGKHGIS